MATLAQIRNRVRSLAGVYATALLPDDDIDLFVNDAYHEVNGIAPWPFLTDTISLSVPAGDATATLPLTPRDIRQVVATDPTFGRRTLEPSSQQLSATWPSSLSGRLSRWAWDGSALLRFNAASLAPTELEVVVQQRVGSLTGAGSLPVWPDEYHSALSYAAAAAALVREGDDTQRASAYLQAYEATVERMRRDLLTSAPRTTMWAGGVRPSWRKMGVRR